jgi:hypothetical protein
MERKEKRKRSGEAVRENKLAMTVRGHSSAIITQATWYRRRQCIPASPGEILQTPWWCVYCEGCPDPPLPHILRPLFRQSLFLVSLPADTTHRSRPQLRLYKLKHSI